MSGFDLKRRIIQQCLLPEVLCLVLVLSFLSGSAAGCDRPVLDSTRQNASEIPEIRLGGPALGTTYNIRIRLDPDSPAAIRISQTPDISAILEKDIQTEIEQINAAMSNWHATSEISRFNNAGSDPFPISNDFALVVREARRIYKLSGGAFDPARDSLFALWGFGGGQNSDQATRTPPDDAAIAAVQKTSGMARLKLSGSDRGHRLKKTAPELRLNLSAIAKGHAVDRVFTLLENHALLTAASEKTKNHSEQKPAIMVEIGGEVRVGRIINERKWQLGIERPEYTGRRRAISRVTQLEQIAMATSGDYRNYFVDDADGTRYSHILDPRTGRPETTGVAQATVIGPSCMTADALATTLLVLGEAAGLKLIESQPEYEALLLIAQPDQSFRAAATEGMRRWMRE